VFHLLLIFLLHAICSLIIGIAQNNKVSMVNSTHYQAMCRAFSSSFGLCFFQYLKISKLKDKRSMQRFSEDTKTHNIINIRTYIYEAKQKKMDERWAELCQLSAPVFSLFFFLSHTINFFFKADNNKDWCYWWWW